MQVKGSKYAIFGIHQLQSQRLENGSQGKDYVIMTHHTCLSFNYQEHAVEITSISEMLKDTLRLIWNLMP
jgi:hypothetical protein